MKKVIVKKNKTVTFSKEIINKLKKAEEEIDNGEGISADVVFKELRQKYGY